MSVQTLKTDVLVLSEMEVFTILTYMIINIHIGGHAMSNVKLTQTCHAATFLLSISMSTLQEKSVYLPARRLSVICR